MAGLATLYHLSVPVRTLWRRDVPGAAVAVVFWIVGSYVLREYIQAYVSRESAYGQLGAVVASLLFLYFTAMAVLFGRRAQRRDRQALADGGDRRGPPPRARGDPAAPGAARGRGRVGPFRAARRDRRLASAVRRRQPPPATIGQPLSSPAAQLAAVATSPQVVVRLSPPASVTSPVAAC